jgi:starch synthase
MLPIGKIREILSAATVFVCPSVYEPLGIVNLEAMACGTAVVASDVGGIPEVVDDGVTGLLFDPGDEVAAAEAVVSILGDPENAALMGKRGVELARTFSSTTTAARYAALYQRLLTSQEGPTDLGTVTDAPLPGATGGDDA